VEGRVVELQGDNLAVVRLGRMAYGPALDTQRRAVERVRRGREDGRHVEYLLLVEHDPPVITLGRSGKDEHLLATPERLAALGIEYYESSRGGDVTYHGPGQLVAYPVLALNRHGRDVHRYLRDVEQTVLGLLGGLGLDGRRDERYTGVWVGNDKVCAIGVAITRWVSYHGLALNVSTDLDYFGLIVPCGIRERGVTSLARLLGRDVPLAETADALVGEFVRVFGFDGATELAPDDL